jgi:single-strand DNA-binding protein
MSRHIVIEGTLTRDPAGGYGKESGKAYCHLDVAVNDRVKSTNGQWIDGPATYYRVTVFGTTAENATNSLVKGNTVLITGELTVRTYTRTDGTSATASEIVANHLGAALTHTTIDIPTKGTSNATRTANSES